MRYLVSTFTVLVVSMLALGCNDSKRRNAVGLPAPSLTVTTTSVPPIQSGQPYSTQLAASGAGSSGVTWNLANGNLPQGVVLDANGLLSGTATVQPNTSFSFRAQVTDNASGATATRDLTLFTAKQVTINTTSLPQGSLGQSYTGNLFAVGGTQPYTWTLLGGSLPPGLTLGSNGIISGTPTQAGTFVFNVRVDDTADAAGQANATAQLGITVQ